MKTMPEPVKAEVGRIDIEPLQVEVVKAKEHNQKVNMFDRFITMLKKNAIPSKMIITALTNR